MEPLTIAGALIKGIAPKGVEFLQEGINKKFNPDEIQKALHRAIEKATEEERQLFRRCPRDSWKSVSNFLHQFFEQQVEELQKPLKQGVLPDVAFLVKAFKKADKDFFGEPGKLNSPFIEPWLKVFCQTYFENIRPFLKFQVAKEDYFQQLANWFDDVKFAGMPVAGQEVEKSEKLAQIFVMPDVVEDVGTDFVFDLGNYGGKDARQQALLDQQRLRASSKPSGRKFLASQLLQQTDSKKFVLLGAPGSGKTTLASYFAVMLAQGKTEKLGLDPDVDYLPIIIRIRDLAREEKVSILEFAKDFAEKRLTVKDLPTGFFNYWLEDGRAVILLDGLDEVAETGKRYDIVSRIENFLGQFPKNLAIITSRPAGYKRDFFRTEEFPHFELQAFGDDKVEEFINRWYDSRVKDQAEATRRKESLQKALEENERIKLLARNPLLLTIIALIHRYQAVLPKERFKLYDKAVETLIISWDAKKEITAHKKLQYLSLDDLRRILEIIAYWIHTEGNTGDQEGGTLIDCKELLGKLKREIKTLKGILPYEAKEEAKRFLSLIQERTGLLNEQGQDCYAFVHKTFQEYLCAQAIDYDADNEGDFEIILDHIRSHLHDPHWREVLLLLIAQQKPKKAAKAIRAILNNGSDYEQWLHRDLFFAGSCLAEDIKGLEVADADLVEEILSRLVALEVSEGSKIGRRVRDNVFGTLRRLYETAFEKQALDLLKGEEDRIHKVALQVYRAELGEKECVKVELLNILRNEGPLLHIPNEALVFIGYKSANIYTTIEVFSRLFPKKGIYGITMDHAKVAVSKFGNCFKDITKDLIELKENETILIRSGVAYALGFLGDSSEEVIIALLELLNDKNANVRDSAAEALIRLGKASEEVVTALLLLLNDDDSEVRRRALLSLGRSRNASKGVVNALLSFLGDYDSKVRNSTAVALSWLGEISEEVVTTLLSLLNDDDSKVRSSAAQALSELGKISEELVTTLLSLLNDDDSIIRSSAAKALSKLGEISEELVTTSLSLLNDDDSTIRFSSAYVLGKSGKASEEVVTALLPLLRDNYSYVRSNAAMALGNLGKQNHSILPQLVQWLQENEDYPHLGDGINALWQIVNETS